MEEIRARHKQEQRELQNLITSKKKSASKKTRKGVNDECARLEAELKESQEKELAELNGDAPSESNEAIAQEDEESEKIEVNGQAGDDVANGVASAALPNGEAAAPVKVGGGKKPNRQKARLARRAAAHEEAAANAEAEAQNMPDLRAKEQEVMEKEINARGLKMKEIRADGHCLYSAFADQLEARDIQPRTEPTSIGGEEAYRTVRRAAAEYMKKNRDDFEPFLEEPFDEYVRKVAETGEWGGQLELKALAQAYNVSINVLDGNGSIHGFPGSDSKGSKRLVWLAYYRHGFGLGEHYNSLRNG